MKAWVFKSMTFEAAHTLPDHPGKCKALHGHTYKVELGLQGPIQKETDMVLDMGLLGSWLTTFLTKWDHTYLNSFFVNPTAECLAEAILAGAIECFATEDREFNDIQVTVYETPTSWVTINYKEL